MPKEDVLSELPQFMSEMRGFATEVRIFVKDQLQFNTDQWEFNDFLRENVVLKDDLKEELKNFVTKDEFNSLRGDVRIIDERTQRIETDVKILKKEYFRRP